MSFVQGDGMVVHRDSEINNSKTPFKFTPENMKRIEVMISKYPPEYKVISCFIKCRFSTFLHDLEW